MTSDIAIDRTEAIACLNDRARLGLDPTARIVFTHASIATFCDPDSIEVLVVQAQLLAAFRACSFAEDSPERDFASIEFRGHKVWLKIDAYDRNLEFGSEDPADASVTTRVVTILLPSDY